MIINSGSRTDIPAFYSKWFMNRVREGFVMVRNPYYPEQVTRYRLDPAVVDVLAFCTKNPEPMLPYLEELKMFRQFWFVTITPYGKEIEENVPDKTRVMAAFRRLSEAVGKKAVIWRYDPIFVSDQYSVGFHIEAFEKMAEELRGYTRTSVISFIDLYEKTKRNFPEVRAVTAEEQIELTKAFVSIGERYGMTIRTCLENRQLSQYGAVTDGCMTRDVLEEALGITLETPKGPGARPECACILGNDIGMYNTCAHFCKYCYANYDRAVVLRNMRRHDPESPYLIGGPMPGDVIREANQKSWANGQMSLFL
ncbi:MAG: DUF1848 domain-containing protein [Oscillospiraceae bacterium]|nr:DUF1848 domain-containing protein [Oscillospiraceae bacterium]